MNEEIKQLEEKRAKLKSEETALINELYNVFDDTDYDEEHDRQLEKHFNSPEIRLENITMRIRDMDEKIGSYRRTEFLKNNIAKINKNSIKTLDEDYLNRNELAKVIADLIKQQNKNDKLSIGLLGEWGSGKSTFLSLVRKQLDEDSNIIQFNASKYDDQEQIWYSLLLAVSKKYLSNKKIRFKKVRYIYNSILAKKETDLLIGSIVAPVLFITSTTLFSEYIQKNNDFPNFLGVLTGVSSIITGVLSYDLLKRLYGNIRDYFNSSKEKFMKQLKYPNYKKYLGTRENVRQDLIVFKNLIIKQSNSESTSKNMVIMVDELDRCSDTTIINFFSSIEAFIDIPGIIFVFSINPEIVYPVVAKAIPHRKADEKELNVYNQTRLGAMFIEKYINIFFTLPISSNYNSYIKEILTDIIDEQSIEKITILINTISNKKKTTPREIKKILDLIMIYNTEFPDLTLVEFSTLLIMKYYYKDFTNIFSEINPRSNIPFKELRNSKFKLEKTLDIPDAIILCAKDLLAESNMNSISSSMYK
ncbi:KAP family NTPase, partial [Bacillus cereus]|nr:KAP family NTPase [Bacillus cereus]